MSEIEIPVSATARSPRRQRAETLPAQRFPRVLVTGAAGVLGTVLARDLAADHELIALDPAPVHEPQHWAEARATSVGDRDAVLALMAHADYAIHLAHGAYGGWEGLREVEIEGTRNILDGALRGPCRRVLLASSNHVVGWAELDSLAGQPTDLPVHPWDPPRPDGLYGVAKATLEALGRAAAECSGLPVSVLRVGTVRRDDDPELAAREPWFGYIGDLNAVRQRLSRTWLHHRDLVRMVREEFAAGDTFRLRYAVSNTDDTLWSTTAMTWNTKDSGSREPIPG